MESILAKGLADKDLFSDGEIVISDKIKELISTVIVLVALLPISFIVYKLKDNFLLPVVIEFIGVAGTIIATTKDDNNLCVVSQIKYMIEFSKIQKQYRYKYYNKWREDIV